MLIKREQMRLKQTHYPTSSKKIKRLKTTKIHVQFVLRLGWDEHERTESGKADGWLEEAHCQPPLWAWRITPTFNRAYGTWDDIILQVQGQTSFMLFEYIYIFIDIFFLKTYTCMYIKLYKKQGITSIFPI